MGRALFLLGLLASPFIGLACTPDPPLTLVRVTPPRVNPIIVPDKSGVVVVYASPVKVSKPAYETVLVRVTGYCPCSRCCGRMTGRTSTGANAWNPGVAADPRWLPPGTRVMIPGYEEDTQQEIDDRGGKLKREYWIKGIPRMDVRFKYHWQARDWGEQFLRVKVYFPVP